MKLSTGADIKVAIPLKTNSVRVHDKNLREFSCGLSLFDIKMRQLLAVFPASDIYVSSEDEKVSSLCAKYGANFLRRDPSLTPNSAPWWKVVKDVVGGVPAGSDIMWVQVTQPLFNEFEAVLAKWKEVREVNDSLAVVRKVGHHIIDSRGHPVNFEFGYWHRISQELPSLYEVTWSCFCMRREMVDVTGYQIGRSPFLYETDAPLVDIDSPKDFEVASILYRHYHPTRK